MSKIIGVTGSKGFIGRALCRALRANGHNVIECDLPECDVGCMDLLEKLLAAEVIYHLAVMPLGACKKDHVGCVKTNVIGTTQVMETAIHGKTRRIIYASASSVYGNPARIPIPEGAPLNPLTLYGATKCASEGIIKAYSRAHELTYVILRFTNVYGPGQHAGLIPAVINSIMHNSSIEVRGDGEQTRDFIYIDDIVDILIKAMDRPLYSTTVNVGTGKGTSVNCIIDHCASSLQRPAVLHYVMYDDDRLAFRADITLLKALYGPLRFTGIARGLEKTVEQYKQPRPVSRQGDSHDT